MLVLNFQLLAQSTIDSVPNQKLITGSYVSNPDNLLDSPTVTIIDTLLHSLEKSTTVQVSVVALESIGSADVFNFAQQLFVKWGIGHRENDNGLLILLVNDSHTIRFHTGFGLEGVLPDILCKRIQQQFMVPEFKNGNLNTGMLAGVKQVEKILTDPTYAAELTAPEAEEPSSWISFITFLIIFCAPVVIIIFIIKSTKGRFADSARPEFTPYPEMRLKRLTWIFEFALMPVMIVIFFGLDAGDNTPVWCFITLYMYFMATQFLRLWRMRMVIHRLLLVQDYYEIVEFIRKDQLYWLGIAMLFPFPFFVYFFYHLTRKHHYRNHARLCKQCHGKMRKLSEKTEDEFLSKEQQIEESIHSVDYDVWQCNDCHSIEMWYFLNRHSKYQVCPKCNVIAYRFVSRRTIDNATYSSSGKGEETHSCTFCGYQQIAAYTIAQLTKSSSSSSSDSFSSSSSGFGSSSGGSWGGGDSGGGGASSKW